MKNLFIGNLEIESLILHFNFHYVHRYAERLVLYYSEVAEEGQKHGLLVFGHDHIGHGESEGNSIP